MSRTQITAEPGTPFIDIVREFDAPRDFIFRAHTDPELLVQWLGPRHLTMAVDFFNARAGGGYRYVHRDPAGNEHWFHGVFHGAPSVEDGIVQTFEYEGYPGHVSLESMTFEDRGGTTVLRALTVFQSVADRDGMVATGMEGGVNDGYDRLVELVGRLAPVR